MEEKVYEEWTKPDWTQVDSEYLTKLQENNDCYKTAIEEIISEIESENQSDQKIKNIKETIDQLQEELYYV